MLKVIKSKTLANFLMKEGLVCKRTDNDRKNPKYMIFLFELNEDLNKAMIKWNQLKNN